MASFGSKYLFIKRLLTPLVQLDALPENHSLVVIIGYYQLELVRVFPKLAWSSPQARPTLFHILCIMPFFHLFSKNFMSFYASLFVPFLHLLFTSFLHLFYIFFTPFIHLFYIFFHSFLSFFAPFCVFSLFFSWVFFSFFASFFMSFLLLFCTVELSHFCGSHTPE